jgi:hypothetical protein
MTLRACSLSAACLYFGLGLSNRMANATTVAGEDEAGVAVPLGMMGVSWGGTLIEQWTNLEHQKPCRNISCLGCEPNTSANGCEFTPETARQCTGNGALYNGMVAPFVNMSVKGFVWYQGENNCGGDAGTVLQGTGYACMLGQMGRGWIKAFSDASGAGTGTAADAPFGVVTLADGGWEGNPANAGPIHWAETTNYGTLPSPSLPSGFVATAHDVGDPWNSQACTRAGCCNDWQAPNISNGCSGDTRWMVKMSSYDSRHGGWKDGHVPIYPGTSHLMSSVHPRTKKFVGERLAQAAWAGAAYGHASAGAAVGPVLSGCSLAPGSTKLVLKFNASLLRGEKVRFKGYNSK